MNRSKRTSWAVVVIASSVLVACGEREQPRETAVSEAPDAPAIAVVEATRSDEGVTAGGSWTVRWRSGPEGILPLEPFSLEVEVRDAEGRVPGEMVVVTADAAMPHHGHGMNFVPRTTSLGDGRYRIDGLLFHMRGRWEMFVDVERDGLLERAQWTLEVE